jgi:hypothetical protein
MAALLGAQAGKAPFLMNATATPALYLGTPANATALAGAVQITIPTDPAGSAYKALLITSSGSGGSGAVWINFSSDGTAATVGGPNCYLIPAASTIAVVPPLGATKIGAIPATGVTTPDICVIGLY